MNKITKALIFYLSLIILSIIFQSCCPTQKIIGEGEIRVFINQQNQEFQLDTIASEFTLDIEYETEIVDNNFRSLSILTEAMATSCAPNFVNVIDSSSITLSVDKNFTYDGQIIEPDSNFFNNVDLRKTVISNYAYIEIVFTTAFLDKAQFQEENYTFKIISNTDDGFTFEHKKNLYMKL